MNEKSLAEPQTDDSAEAEIIRRAMSAIGRRSTPKKTAAAAANLAPYRAEKGLLGCNCGKEPHTAYCREYHRQKSAESRARKKQRAQEKGLETP